MRVSIIHSFDQYVISGSENSLKKNLENLFHQHSHRIEFEKSVVQRLSQKIIKSILLNMCPLLVYSIEIVMKQVDENFEYDVHSNENNTTSIH